MTEERLRGLVAWYNAERGFGVISGDDNEEYFVHHTNVTPGLRLMPRLDVAFRARNRATSAGLEAYDVMPADPSDLEKVKVPEHQLTGRVSWYRDRDNVSGNYAYSGSPNASAKGGFGVIAADNGQEYFVHGSNLGDGVSLQEGAEVTFLVRLRQFGMSGLEAYDVKLSPRQITKREEEERDREARQDELLGHKPPPVPEPAQHDAADTQSDRVRNAEAPAAPPSMPSVTSGGYWLNRSQQGATREPFAPGQIVTRKVVGVTYEGRQAVVAELKQGDTVLLCREPSNPYDHNAIRVVREDSQQIGYIDRLTAAVLAPYFDRGRIVMVTGTVTQLTGGYTFGSSRGVAVGFVIPFLDLTDNDPEDSEDQ